MHQPVVKVRPTDLRSSHSPPAVAVEAPGAQADSAHRTTNHRTLAVAVVAVVALELVGPALRIPKDHPYWPPAAAAVVPVARRMG